MQPINTPALNIAKANIAIAHATRDLAIMAVWTADLGKDADEARVVYRNAEKNLEKAEAILHALTKTD